MKIDGYSDKREAHAHLIEGRWVVYPQAFAVFVASYELPSQISVAVPGTVEPDINSDEGYVVASTWRAIMEEYLSVDEPPYEFEYRDIPESEMDSSDDPEDAVY